jgi:anhydro-N-acetylmuramic acid kinase
MPLYVGLISGTSMDGVEAALLHIADGDNLANGNRFAVRAAAHLPYPAELETRLRAAVAEPSRCDLDEYGALDAAIGEHFALAALQLLEQAGIEAEQIRAIGSHGQTLLHRPRAALPFTLQIGDAHRIAERTGIDVIADFRRRDLAAGGEAAPLMPAFHAAAFGAPGRTRVVANIGGIGNITVLAADGAVSGFDTGPGNCLMDLWIAEQRGQPYDKDGAFAASAPPDAALLQRMLAEPYLARKPPKSTGRELFHRAWLERQLTGASLTTAAPQVLQSTLCEFTAATLADAILALPQTAEEVLVCGGGAFNIELMRRLAARLPGIRVADTATRGIAPAQVEAAGFAWLAHAFLEGMAGNIVAVTGARGPRVLGALHKGRVTKL